MAIKTYNEVSKTITYNGISSADVGVVVGTFPNYNYPARQVEAIHVPGLNGDILLDDGTFQNVNRVYKISAHKKDADFNTVAMGVVKWLHPSPGYHKLEDGYDPGAYRMAAVIDENEFVNMFNMAGTGTLTFNCKPQRYLNSGDTPVTISGTSYTLTNAGNYASKPLIRVVMSNKTTPVELIFTSNTTSEATRITLLNSGTRPNEIFIDCELQDAYYKSNGYLLNANLYLKLTDNRFPVLESGKTTISMTSATRSAISKMEVTPKWWTL